jgi:nucleotide-binding universal stress UspA family protein
MKNVLLIIPPGVKPRTALDEAIGVVRETRGSLVALVILDPTEAARIAATLDSAFMGERVSDRLVEVLAREHRSRAEDLLQDIGARAAEAGVSFVPLVESGDPSEVCTRVIRTYQVQLAVLAAERRSWLARFLSRSAAVKLPALAGCEVKVMEEEEAEGGAEE